MSEAESVMEPNQTQVITVPLPQQESIGQPLRYMLKIEFVPMISESEEYPEIDDKETELRLKSQLEPGVRSVFTLTFVRSRVIRQATTTAYLYDFRDRDGNQFQWLTYRSRPSLEEGKSYKIKASVKKHYNRRGVRIVALTRGKILS